MTNTVRVATTAQALAIALVLTLVAWPSAFATSTKVAGLVVALALVGVAIVAWFVVATRSSRAID